MLDVLQRPWQDERVAVVHTSIHRVHDVRRLPHIPVRRGLGQSWNGR